MNYGYSDIPEGTYTAISRANPVGGDSHGHLCALRTDQTIACWGNNGERQSEPPDGQFIAVATGFEHSCAIRVDGSAVCWGTSYWADQSIPSGRFTSITAGSYHVCALEHSGEVECWGSDNYGQLNVPDGQFSAIRAQDGFTCGLRLDGRAECWGTETWGSDDALDLLSPPDISIAEISLGNHRICGVLQDSTVLCWNQRGEFVAEQPGKRFRSISVGGGSLTCGVLLDNTIDCWSFFESQDLDPPEGQFTTVTAGADYACGIRVDGIIVCWGRPPTFTAPPDDVVVVGHDVPPTFTESQPSPYQTSEPSDDSTNPATSEVS